MSSQADSQLLRLSLESFARVQRMQIFALFIAV